jgi:hypothetical protein
MKKDFMSAMKAKTADLRPSLLSTEENIKRQVQVLDELRNLIPPLTSDELIQLEQNVLKHGIKDPLTVWETTAAAAQQNNTEESVYILIDGHNRYQISQQHQLDFRINVVHFATLEEVKAYMIDYQLGRRNLTPEQASYLRGMRYQQQKKARGSNLHGTEPQINVSEALAKEYGVSSRTIKRDGEYAAALEKLAPDFKRNVLSGQTKLSKSTLSEIAKTEISSPIERIEDLSKRLVDSKADSLTDTLEENTLSSGVDQIQLLQNEIRNLANGRLNRRSCQQLIQKTTELLTLQFSK